MVIHDECDYHSLVARRSNGPSATLAAADDIDVMVFTHEVWDAEWPLRSHELHHHAGFAARTNARTFVNTFAAEVDRWKQTVDNNDGYGDGGSSDDESYSDAYWNQGYRATAFDDPSSHYLRLLNFAALISAEPTDAAAP